MITRLSFLSIALVFLFSPAISYGQVTYDYIDDEDTGGALTISNNYTSEAVKKSEYHIGWYSTSTTAVSFNQITLGDLGYVVVATTTPQVTDLYIYLFPYSTSTIASDGVNLGDALATFVPSGMQVMATDADSTFVSIDGFVTLNPNQHYTFVLQSPWRTCSMPSCVYNFGLDFEYTNGLVSKDSAIAPVYYYRGDTEVYSTYTGQPDRLGMRMEINYDLEEFWYRKYIVSHNFVVIDSTGAEEQLTDCTASTVINPVVYCNTTSDLIGFKGHNTIVYQGSEAGNYNLLTSIKTIDGKDIYQNGGVLATLTNLTATTGPQGFYHLYDAVIASSTPYQVKACFTDKYYGGADNYCAVVVLCNGEFTSATECETAYSSVASISGVIPPATGGEESATSTAFESLYENVKTFGLFAFFFPTMQVLQLQLADYILTGSSSTSTVTTFDIPLDMSAFGLPATTAHLPVSEMFAEAENLSPSLFEYINYFLWGLFWLFILSRILSGAWNVLPERKTFTKEQYDQRDNRFRRI